MAYGYYALGACYYVYHWFLILGGAGLIGAFLLRDQTSPVVASIVASLSVCSVFLGISFWRRRVGIQLRSNNPSLKIQRISIDYNYENPHNSDYVRTVDVVAGHPTDHYRAKFKWSSDGQISGQPLTGAAKVDISDHSVSMFDFCRVEFIRPLGKGEALSFSYRLRLNGATKPIKRFLGHSVDSPTPVLVLRIKLPSNGEVTEYRKQLFLGPNSDMPLWEDVARVNEPWKKELAWEIKNAKQGYYYRVSW